MDEGAEEDDIQMMTIGGTNLLIMCEKVGHYWKEVHLQGDQCSSIIFLLNVFSYISRSAD